MDTKNYKSKYLLYKAKYLKLKKLLGGGKEVKIYNVNDTSKEFIRLVSFLQSKNLI